MPALIKDAGGDRPGCACSNGVDLGERAVLILAPLNEQRRHLDAGQEFFKVPRPEAGVDPGSVPTQKGAIDIDPMVTGQPA